MSGSSKKTIAIIGGTGALGTGLALRWAAAGYPVLIGSRTADKAIEAAAATAAKLRQRGINQATVNGCSNDDAAAAADIVALTVPYAHHAATLTALHEQLSGKILIDVTVPLVPPKVGRVQLPEGGSAGAEAQALLGDSVKVVSALQNVAAALLQEEGAVDCDILVCGNDKTAREEVIHLLADAGMRGLHAGPIQNAAAAEALTSVLITINRQFKSHAGIRVTGLPDSP